jgi:hypothetical protein
VSGSTGFSTSGAFNVRYRFAKQGDGRSWYSRRQVQVSLVLANLAVEKDGPQAALSGSLRASRSGRLSPLR